MGEGTMAPNPGHRVLRQGHGDGDTQIARRAQGAGLVNGKVWLNRPPGRAGKNPVHLHGAEAVCLSVGVNGRLVAKKWRKQIVLSAV